MRLILTLLTIFSLGLPQAMAATPCQGWLSPDFWSTASLIDARDCLATSSPTAHTKDGWTPLHYAAITSTNPSIITTVNRRVKRDQIAA